VGDSTGHPIETRAWRKVEADAPAPSSRPDPLRSSVASISLQQQRIDRLITFEDSENRMKTDRPEVVMHGGRPSASRRRQTSIEVSNLEFYVSSFEF
jgi:hypothetical protein